MKLSQEGVSFGVWVPVCAAWQSDGRRGLGLRLCLPGPWEARSSEQVRVVRKRAPRLWRGRKWGPSGWVGVFFWVVGEGAGLPSGLTDFFLKRGSFTEWCL